MRRCVKCIMPETAEGITFDEKGVCNLCRDFRKVERKGESELRKVIKEHVDGNEEFNCVVPVSGGRDSAFALYYAKQELGLKPIAVHNDNDFETEIARKNLEAITKSLDVPLVRTNSKREISKRIVAEKFKMNAPFSAGLVLEQTCEACKYGFESAAYNTARSKAIKLVIWGDSTEESTVPYHELVRHKRPSKWERLRSKGAISFLRYKYYFNRMKREYGPDSADGLKEIHLYDYIEWDRRKIVETIQKKLGWSKPEGSTTSWRIDCSLVPLVDYLTWKAHGVSKIDLGFSNMVRGGKMDREDAIREAEEIEKKRDSGALKVFLKEIGIPGWCSDWVL